MGDALGVLHGAQKSKANDVVLNLIMAEAALILAPMGRDIRAIHLWTQRNVTCDRLSRLQGATTAGTAQEQTEIPKELRGAQRTARRSPECKVLSGRNFV